VVKRCHAHEHRKPASLIFLSDRGGSMRMPAIAYVLAGFMAGLFVMTILSLYKYVVKIMSR
jgi:hypothetical protein